MVFWKYDLKRDPRAELGKKKINLVRVVGHVGENDKINITHTPRWYIPVVTVARLNLRTKRCINSNNCESSK